jgi:signal transduction histidine kinase
MAALLLVIWPTEFLAKVLAVVLSAVIVAVGMQTATRRSSVRSANRLLATDLPEPSAPRRAATAAWLLAWSAAGTVLMLATLTALVALVLPVIWLNGGDTVTIIADVDIPSGAAGSWTIAVAAGSLVALAYLCRAYVALMRRLAPRLLGHGLAERLAAAEAEADLAASRNRLARDLHDSIGHLLTTSTIQAAVARQVLETDPESARLALASIEDASRSALDDLDRALGVLREEPARIDAGPTLADLGRLCERAGADLTVDIAGDPDALPPMVSQEAFRIVQEGITNALKHAPGAAVALSIAVTDTHLDLRISNPMPAEPVARTQGRGLTGVAERARLLGGETAAGPDPDGDWTLRAKLPLA